MYYDLLQGTKKLSDTECRLFIGQINKQPTDTVGYS